jgi:ankyrin repeat protein
MDGALEHCARLGCAERMRGLLQASGGVAASAVHSNALWLAARKNHADVVRELLVDGRAAAVATGGLQTAATRGHTRTVQVLLQDGRADPAANGSVALRSSACEDCIEVVRVLLADGRADPAEVDPARLGVLGHDILKALLADGRCDPARRNSIALDFAVTYGHDNNVHALLADGRADPALMVDLHPACAAEVRWRKRRPWLRASAVVAGGM